MSNLSGYAQIISDRPDQSEGPTSVGRGNFQIESGLLTGDFAGNNNTQQDIVQFSSLFRIGLLNAVELRIINQMEQVKAQGESTVFGINDLVIGLKIHVARIEKLSADVGVISHVSLPSAKQNITSDAVQFFNRLAISHQLNETSNLSYNVGYDHLSNGDFVLPYTLAYGKGVNSKLSIYLEAFGMLMEDCYIQLNADAGFTYLISDNIQMDFSFGTGINEKMNYSSVGISWRFETQNKTL